MTKLYLYLVVGLSIMLLGVGWAAKSFYTKNVVLEAQNASLMEASKRAQERMKADRQVLVARQAKIAAQARVLADTREALSEALQRNKTWSDTDVPDDVQKALSGRSGGSDSVPASLRNTH